MLESLAEDATTWALFKSKKFLDFDNVALSFLFDKHCPIMK